MTQLYRSRWDVALDLKHLKTSLDMDILRCKTPDMVRQEIYAFLPVDTYRYWIGQMQLAPKNTTYFPNNIRSSTQPTAHTNLNPTPA